MLCQMNRAVASLQPQSLPYSAHDPARKNEREREGGTLSHEITGCSPSLDAVDTAAAHSDIISKNSETCRSRDGVI